MRVFNFEDNKTLIFVTFEDIKSELYLNIIYFNSNFQYEILNINLHLDLTKQVK